MWSENEALQLLLQSLESVPLADAMSFFLPTDPFDVLLRSLDALNLKPYEERWAASAEAILYIKGLFSRPPPSCELRSEMCWEEEDHECESNAYTGVEHGIIIGSR